MSPGPQALQYLSLSHPQTVVRAGLAAAGTVPWLVCRPLRELTSRAPACVAPGTALRGVRWVQSYLLAKAGQAQGRLLLVRKQEADLSEL